MEKLRECTDKYIYLDGYKFTRDDKSGYYRCDSIKKRLHRYVWEKYNGDIPEGFHIHHKNHDKANNHIDNLALVSHSSHAEHHMLERETNESYIAWRSENFEKNVRPKAAEWHRSKEGREWHSRMARDQAELRTLDKFKCDNCNKHFKAWSVGDNKFCSNKCKSAKRRKSGVDDEVRSCEYCESEFMANKYSKKRFCSRSCSNKAIPRLPNIKRN